MNHQLRRVAYRKSDRVQPELLAAREWLVTNGLGGYASGTLAGVITRGFHGYLIAALSTPLGRVMMLNDLVEKVENVDGQSIQLGGEERVNTPLKAHGSEFLQEFLLEDGNPVWIFQFGDSQLEKRVIMVHRQNTVHIGYRLKGPGKFRLMLRPSVNFRHHEAPVSTPLAGNYAFTVVEDSFEISSQTAIPPLRLMLYGQDKSLTMDRTRFQEVVYRIEESRGYAAQGDLWSPGYFSVVLNESHPVTLVASSESWDTIRAITPEYAAAAEKIRRQRLLNRSVNTQAEGPIAELVLAADQFIIVPEGRAEDTMRARAAGDEVRTVIAGYHWFTDWGRDTMISLEGLTLTTCRHVEAGYILRTFAHYIRDGLIPNMFPEGTDEGLYHTADATLWFFHAIARYLSATGDQQLLPQLLPRLEDIVEWHIRGTKFGIGVDAADGLLRQGASGYQLTWMDAKVGDWVVTPRRGKAVEINALWYNALCYMERWLRDEHGEPAARPYAEQAERARRSFNRRFWYAEGGYLYDVLDGEDGEDPACRPNQVLALALAHPVLDSQRWRPVLDVVRERLLTPVGLRSLAPGHPDYKAKYYGDLRARDAAYHQGTVWAWLIGPFVDAWLRTHPGDTATARSFLTGFEHHVSEACVGSISEVF